MDQLREVLDRVDVVVRRWGDKLLAGLRVAQARDEVGHLHPGQLAAFARLRPLRDLDLQLVGAFQVARRDAESRGRDLLHAIVPPDGGGPPDPPARTAVVVVGVRVLAAFA
jgi:hypothetical protein